MTDVSDFQGLSNERLRKVLTDLRNQMTYSTNSKSITNRKGTMNLLHEFNDLKDATQIIIGILANKQGITIKQVFIMYGLPLNE